MGSQRGGARRPEAAPLDPDGVFAEIPNTST